LTSKQIEEARNLPSGSSGFASKKPLQSRTIFKSSDHPGCTPNPRSTSEEKEKPTRDASPSKRSKKKAAEAGKASGSVTSSMLELLLVGCSSVVVLLHGASLFLRALFAPRHAVARPIRCVRA